MVISLFDNPGLVVGLALALGMIAQAIAHHLKIPGIVLLLICGVVFGPDGFGVIQPGALGPALTILTGFAVSIILFEGGMNLKFNRLKRAQHSIRQLIFIGGVCTVAGGALASHYIMDWSWKISILFGTLVMVTGPTVINPLLRRLKVKRSVATVLEAEGVLIDAVGAVVATVALEAALSPEDRNILLWGWNIISRIGFGMLAGGVVAWVLILLYRIRRLIPEGTENVFTLSIILALFQGSNLILHESGIAAVTMAGILIGNFGTYTLDDLLNFKEELTIMMIGMLFVLLAADVRLSQVINLGLPGVTVVLVMMLGIRPASVLIGTAFSGLSWKERIFIGWIGPRGIVAAAVASFFAVSMTEKGLTGGYELRAMVFLMIALTVVVAGLTGGVVARGLGLAKPHSLGWVILGANSLARALARLFKDNGDEIVCIDSNADHCTAAEKDCTRVIYGNGLQSRHLLRAEVDTRRGALALTSNDEVNYLFVQKVKEEKKEISLFAALKNDTTSLTRDMLRHTGTELAFGTTIDIELWDRRFKSGRVNLQIWKLEVEQTTDVTNQAASEYKGNGLIQAAFRRNKKLYLVGDKKRRYKKEDALFCFIYEPELEMAAEFIEKAGWRLIESFDSEALLTSSCQLPIE